MGLLKIFLVVGIVTAAGFYFLGCPCGKVDPPKPNDANWWTVKKPTKEDTSIKPFKIQVSDAVLKDLKERLTSATRIPKPLSGINFEYGINGDFVQKIRDYWLNKYQWRQREKLLNQYPQFLTNIEGLDIHFLHIKPESTNKKTVPLILLHGWPGAIVEFYKMIPMLKNSKEFSFELIIPSLPGYGFSQGSELPGLGYVEIGQIMHKLMVRLGHDKYYVQGGDWGSIIGTFMGVLYPKNVKAVHLNMCFANSAMTNIKQILASFAPNLFFHETDAKLAFPLSEVWKRTLRETGYMHLQATKPDTIGTALNDSPIGLAAYIIEKFSHWTNKNAIFKKDGDLPGPFTMDELLDNVMMYWVTGSITTSVRLYSEAFSAKYFNNKYDSVIVEVPSACNAFPEELVVQPEAILKDRYVNMIRFTRMPKGGHFAAFEQPKLLSDDIVSFVAQVEKL